MEEVRESRAERREAVLLCADVRHEAIGTFTTRVRDISTHGIRLDWPYALPSDAQVELTLKGIGAVEGNIAWRRDGLIGVRFDEPIEPKRAMQRITTRKPVDRSGELSKYRRPGLRWQG